MPKLHLVQWAGHRTIRRQNTVAPSHAPASSPTPSNDSRPGNYYVSAQTIQDANEMNANLLPTTPDNTCRSRPASSLGFIEADVLAGDGGWTNISCEDLDSRASTASIASSIPSRVGNNTTNRPSSALGFIEPNTLAGPPTPNTPSSIPNTPPSRWIHPLSRLVQQPPARTPRTKTLTITHRTSRRFWPPLPSPSLPLSHSPAQTAGLVGNSSSSCSSSNPFHPPSSVASDSSWVERAETSSERQVREVAEAEAAGTVADGDGGGGGGGDAARRARPTPWYGHLHLRRRGRFVAEAAADAARYAMARSVDRFM